MLVENLQCAMQCAGDKREYKAELDIAPSLTGEHAYKSLGYKI